MPIDYHCPWVPPTRNQQPLHCSSLPPLLPFRHSGCDVFLDKRRPLLPFLGRAGWPSIPTTFPPAAPVTSPYPTTTLRTSPYLEDFTMRVRYVNGSFSCPPAMINIPGAVNPVPNLEHKLWLCQDRLILQAIQASIAGSVAPLISSCATAVKV
ncbi:hypothetical protein BHE74_00019228 [Ensete ventricosum]|nr:hypothetical protein BHE74_00019228 [Ensete ventricosum]